MLIHIMVWVFWFVVPFLFSHGLFKEPLFVLPHLWVNMLLSIMLFYLNYLLLIERFLFNHRIAEFVIINIVLVLLSIIISELLKPLLFNPAFEPQFRPEIMMSERPPRGRSINMLTISFVFTISVAVAINTTKRWLKIESERSKLETEHLRSELNNLKMQLNPHFFFNTLNNIYSLIQISPERAQKAVHGLGKLMRYHLYETNSEKVPIKGELEFIRNYVAIMQLRTTSNVKITLDCDVKNPDDKIAPLLFVPIIENAFKFGVSSDSSSEINIMLTGENHKIELIVSNTLALKSQDLKSHEGIGLSNLQKRLDLIYHERYYFSAREENNTFKVNLIVQLKGN
jgi:sensor histidine kinase YesM